MKRPGYRIRIKMRTADLSGIDLDGLKTFWRELFMIFCHVFWLTEINGQSFNEAQWISAKTISNMNINVNHFKKIDNDKKTVMISTA